MRPCHHPCLHTGAGRGARWGGMGRTAKRAVTVPTEDSASTWMARACARPAFRAAAARSPAAFLVSMASTAKATASVTPSTARGRRCTLPLSPASFAAPGLGALGTEWVPPAATRCSVNARVALAGLGSSAMRAAPLAPLGLDACSSASASMGAPAMGPPGAATALLVTR